MKVLWVALLAVAGVIVAGTIKTGTEFIDDLKINVSLSKFPGISKGNLEFPLLISIINPSNIGIKLDSLFASIYKNDGGVWRHVASSSPGIINIEIKPFATSNFNLTLKATALTAITNISSSLQNMGSNEFKVETRVGIHGQVVKHETLMTI